MTHFVYNMANGAILGHQHHWQIQEVRSVRNYPWRISSLSNGRI